MKKLMIIAAIAMAVSGTQAASYVWKATGGNIYDSSASSTKFTGTAFVFDAGVTTMSALYDAFAGGSDISSYAGKAASLNVNAGSIVTTSSANQFTYGEEGAGNPTSYSFYLAVVDGDNIYFSNLLSDKAVLAPPTAQSLTFQSQNNSSTTFSNVAPASGFQGAGKWSAVPEPTSGLLMLVGLGALALRRRRA